MNAETTEKIAQILGVSEDSVTALPDDFKNAMVSAVNLNNTDSEENAVELYEALNDLWTKGMIELSLREIADHTGIDLNALHSLDDGAKHTIVYEYAMDSNDIDRFYEIVGRSLSVSSLAAVAVLLGVGVDTLTVLPIAVQKKMCGHYDFMFEAGGDNSALADELREMMKS